MIKMFNDIQMVIWYKFGAFLEIQLEYLQKFNSLTRGPFKNIF
jgi:hypothetical protein